MLSLGGTLNGNARFAEDINYRVKAKDTHIILEKIILLFKENKVNGETFNELIDRIGINFIKSVIIGENI